MLDAADLQDNLNLSDEDLSNVEVDEDELESTKIYIPKVAMKDQDSQVFYIFYLPHIKSWRKSFIFWYRIVDFNSHHLIILIPHLFMFFTNLS